MQYCSWQIQTGDNEKCPSKRGQLSKSGHDHIASVMQLPKEYADYEKCPEIPMKGKGWVSEQCVQSDTIFGEQVSHTHRKIGNICIKILSGDVSGQ